MDKIAFGKRLKKYREEAGFSQEALAELINMSTIFISYIERGKKSPGLDTLVKLANTLSISTDILLGNDVRYNAASRISYFENKLGPLSPDTQQKIFDYLDALINLELEYSKTIDGGQI